MNIERKTEIIIEEIEEDENDFYADDDAWGEGCCEDAFGEDDDEPIEREYCD
ncbi:MAG: hypothetical protein IBX43_02215 [Campylobacterales bacterium]|nr:hypothetical protein [Campylobacterales bacterium]